jgi:hypothetical protein
MRIVIEGDEVLELGGPQPTVGEIADAVEKVVQERLTELGANVLIGHIEVSR